MSEKVRQQLVDDHFFVHVWRSKSQGSWHGERLARGTWNLPQQGQDLLDLGQRGRPTEDHLHAKGRRRQGGVRQAGKRYQGCRGFCQEGIWTRLYVGQEIWLHPRLPNKPWHRYE